MKRDVNFLFFGLLLLLLVAMVGVMLYSDYTYQKVNRQYMEFKRMFEQAQEELNQSRAEVRAKEAELDEKEQQLIDLFKELNLTKMKESSLSKYYSEVKSEKQRLNEDLIKVTEEKDSCIIKLDKMVMERDTYKKGYELEKRWRISYQNTADKCASEVAKSYNNSLTLMLILDDLDCRNRTIYQDDIEDARDILISIQTSLDKIQTSLDEIRQK